MYTATSTLKIKYEPIVMHYQTNQVYRASVGFKHHGRWYRMPQIDQVKPGAQLPVYPRHLTHPFFTFKGVLHPRPVFWLFMHFSQKLQHIGNK